MSKKIENQHLPSDCKARMRSIDDTMAILGGKWKIRIIGALSFGSRRFMELQREVEGIGAKMLSQELRDLELNELVSRTVYDTKPVTVEYELTAYGETLQSIIGELAKWGEQHRRRIMKTIRKTEERPVGV